MKKLFKRPVFFKSSEGNKKMKLCILYNVQYVAEIRKQRNIRSMRSKLTKTHEIYTSPKFHKYVCQTAVETATITKDFLHPVPVKAVAYLSTKPRDVPFSKLQKIRIHQRFRADEKQAHVAKDLKKEKTTYMY